MKKGKDILVAEAIADKLSKATTDKEAALIMKRFKKKLLSKYSLATVKKKLSIYRKHNPKYKELFSLTSEQYSKIEKVTNDNILKRAQNQIGVPLGIIELAKNHLNSSDKYKRAVALQLLIGRRISEVLFSARLSSIGPYKALFSGQLKKKDNSAMPYQIPTLHEADQLTTALKQVQAAFNCQRLEDTAQHLQRLNNAARELFSDHLGPNMTTHSLRRCYAALAYYLEGTKEQHSSVYFSKILGHEIGSTADRNYYQFFVKE